MAGPLRESGRRWGDAGDAGDTGGAGGGPPPDPIGWRLSVGSRVNGHQEGPGVSPSRSPAIPVAPVPCPPPCWVTVAFMGTGRAGAPVIAPAWLGGRRVTGTRSDGETLCPVSPPQPGMSPVPRNGWVSPTIPVPTVSHETVVPAMPLSPRGRVSHGFCPRRPMSHLHSPLCPTSMVSTCPVPTYLSPWSYVSCPHSPMSHLCGAHSSPLYGPMSLVPLVPVCPIPEVHVPCPHGLSCPMSSSVPFVLSPWSHLSCPRGPMYLVPMVPCVPSPWSHVPCPRGAHVSCPHGPLCPTSTVPCALSPWSRVPPPRCPRAPSLWSLLPYPHGPTPPHVLSPAVGAWPGGWHLPPPNPGRGLCQPAPGQPPRLRHPSQGHPAAVPHEPVAQPWPCRCGDGVASAGRSPLALSPLHRFLPCCHQHHGDRGGPSIFIPREMSPSPWADITVPWGCRCAGGCHRPGEMSPTPGGCPHPRGGLSASPGQDVTIPGAGWLQQSWK